MAQINRGDNPIQVSGTFPQPGDQAPEFTLTNQGMEEVTLDTWAGKRKVLNIVPSLDTPTCATYTRKFNEKANGLEDTVVLVVAADLPFAMSRFCGAEGLENVIPLSTFRNYSFQQEYGVAIQDGALAGLCARAVVVLDGNNKVIHSELVDDIKHEPDYEAALKVL